MVNAHSSFFPRFIFLHKTVHLGLSFCLRDSLGLAPAGVWIGVTGHWALTPILLGLGVMTWVRVLSRLCLPRCRVRSKRRTFIRSPAIFGVQRGIEISSFLHISRHSYTMRSEWLCYMSWLYYMGVAIALSYSFASIALSRQMIFKDRSCILDLNGYLSLCSLYLVYWN